MRPECYYSHFDYLCHPPAISQYSPFLEILRSISMRSTSILKALILTRLGTTGSNLMQIHESYDEVGTFRDIYRFQIFLQFSFLIDFQLCIFFTLYIFLSYVFSVDLVCKEELNLLLNVSDF